MRPEDRAREMLAESGIPEAGSTRLVESLSALARSLDEVEPSPGPELTSVMAGAARGAVVPFRRRRARLMVATAVALSTVGAGGVVAAANELPEGAQNLVARFSERYLPFDLPPAEPRPVDDEARLAPVQQTPPAVTESDRVGGVPVLPPPDEPPGAASPEDTGQEVSGTSAATPSSPATSPSASSRSTPSPTPTTAPEAEVDDGDGVDEVDKVGGVDEPEAVETTDPGGEPVTEPQPEDAPTVGGSEPAAPGNSAAPGVSSRRSAEPPGRATSQERRKANAREKRGKPAAAGSRVDER
jgi:hypothetical protein